MNADYFSPIRLGKRRVRSSRETANRFPRVFRYLSIGVIIVGILSSVTGCHLIRPTPPPPPPVPLHIEARDYDRIAQELVDSLMSQRGLRENAVIALAPVAESFDGHYLFDSRTLQEKLELLMLQSGRFRLSFAVDAMGDNTPAVERLRIMQLQYEKSLSVDPADLRHFGNLADIDYMIFGRVSSITSGHGNHRSVTYMFNWRLGNTATGLVEWADEVSIRKGD